MTFSTTEWRGCYDAGWKGLITEDSFAHPAKFARNLIGRIYRHLLDAGYIAPGAVVVDPFGGVALGAVDAMANGLHWLGCELEPRFVALGNRNIDQWNRQYSHSAGWGTAKLLQGDSRRLCEVVGPALADAVCSSPPYSESNQDYKAGWKYIDESKLRVGKEGVGAQLDASYGQTPGQLGTLPAGDVGAVLSSPPYANNDLGGDGQRKFAGSKSAEENKATKDGKGLHGTYGTTAGNLGNLPPGSVADSVVSSPPFEGSNQGTDTAFFEKMEADQNPGPRAVGRKTPPQNYGSSAEQLGNSSGETFWSASKLIVQQCHAILRPGGVACWVLKDFVRNKARVPFSDDWRRLCEACGFVTVEWIKASLVKEWEEATLFDGTQTRRTERKSFFRRLAEKKGSPRIDHEDVLVMVKY